MKLHSLRLHGFKSFADRTEIRFHDGITAVVGPNGCGKSNISDAIRWVLGEQRPSAIRGARMEEAIFQGTVNRRPVNRGSVAIGVTNEDGLLPVPYEEVEISRVVYRDGGSEYFLNRSACRLKDIQELCRDTGLGANAYSVIEGRMIDTILSDRADERRSLFEEAAGIGKYKDRRKEALRRLERAEADLQRLEDVIGEVETKVRSLARQKGKAERYGQYRKRRLDLEVALARRDLEELGARGEALRTELGGDEGAGERLAAEVATAEAEHETLRLQQAEAERERARAAEALDEVQQELVRWERELAVGEERLSHGTERLERIGREREETSARLEALGAEKDEVTGRQAETAAALEELRGELEGLAARTAELRAAFQSVRSELDELETEERSAARRGAQLEGEDESARGREKELLRQRDRLHSERDEARESLAELEAQGDLFSERVETLEDAVTRERAAVEESREEVARLEKRMEEAREAESSARERVAGLAAEVTALERMESAREGLDPVIRAALERPGVQGVLTDFMEVPAELGPVVEGYLGVLARALVVESPRTARDLERWFQREWEGGGGLVLLPGDRAPDAAEGGSLLEAVKPRGAGEPWVRALLAGVDLVEEDGDLDDLVGVDGSPGRDRLTRTGVVADRRGILRLGNPAGVTGALERKEELRSLRARLEEARREADEARKRRESAAAESEEAREGLEGLLARLRESEDGLREVSAEADARAERTARLSRNVEDLDRQVQGLEVALERIRERAEKSRRDREALAQRETRLAETRHEVQGRVEAAEARWEEAREEEAALRIRVTRTEGELERIRERGEALDSEREGARRRLEELREEAARLEAELEEIRKLRAEGRQRLDELFRRREERRQELRGREERMQEIGEQLEEAARKLKETRSRERDAAERRHRVELELQEVEARIQRVRERLEAEWDRPLEDLMGEADPVEGEPDELRAELEEVSRKLERLGPVNMLAVEEHEEESQRLEFLRGQHEDLVKARQDLRSAIREINRTATRRFNETFEGIRENFRATFQRLFEGGECDLWLEDPEDPLESPIEIHASPVGKRTQRIDLLSGGERALTALSLLFGIYLVKPSPFCVLDEVDAPLDESNIGRFIRLLNEFKEQSQFVVITHNPRTIEAADWIYGVTMEEPGVSSIVGVQLEEALEVSGSAA